MRKATCISLALAFLFASQHLFSQSVYTLKADTVKITNCDSAELILENHTQGVKGFLYNKGNGRTEFRRGLVGVSDTVYVIGADTLHLNKILPYAGSGGTAHQVFMLYTRDCVNGSTQTFTMSGWNAQYTGSVPLIHSSLGIQLYIPAGAPAGTQIRATFQGSIIYTMNVTATISADIYIIGQVIIDQDFKYPDQYYVRGATESINAAGVTTNTGFGLRVAGQSFINPSIVFSVTGNTSGTNIRTGATYTVMKAQPGDLIF